MDILLTIDKLSAEAKNKLRQGIEEHLTPEAFTLLEDLHKGTKQQLTFEEYEFLKEALTTLFKTHQELLPLLLEKTVDDEPSQEPQKEIQEESQKEDPKKAQEESEIVEEDTKVKTNLYGMQPYPWEVAFTAFDTRDAVGLDATCAEIESLFKQNTLLIISTQQANGMGKSLLARKYFHEKQAKYDYCVWIPFENTLAESFIQALNPMEGFRFRDGAAEILFEIEKKIIEIPGKKLIVIDGFDNIDDYEVLKNLFPYARAKADVLVTSQLSLMKTTAVTVNALTPTQAQSMFYEHYQLEQNDAALTALLKLIDYHPLMIRLMAKTALQQGLKIQQLWKMWEVIDTPFPKSLPFLLRMAKVVDDPVLWDMLRQFSVLPSRLLPEKILAEMLTLDKNPALPEAVTTLANLGWIDKKIDGKGQAWFKAYKVVQETVRAMSPPDYKVHEILTANVHRFLNVDSDKADFIEKISWLPFGQSLLDYIPNMEEEFLSTLRYIVGISYSTSGKNRKALDLFKETLKYCMTLGREADIDIENVQLSMVMVYKNLRQYNKAKKLLDLMIEKARKNYGDEHDGLAFKMLILSSVCVSIAEYDEAKELLDKAIAIKLLTLKEDHYDMAQYYEHLAVWHFVMHNTDEAKECAVKSYEIIRTSLGDNDPQTQDALLFIKKIEERGF